MPSLGERRALASKAAVEPMQRIASRCRPTPMPFKPRLAGASMRTSTTSGAPSPSRSPIALPRAPLAGERIERSLRGFIARALGSGPRCQSIAGCP